MTDPRYRKLAKSLVEYSTQLKKGDRVLLDVIDVPDEFSIELMRAVRAAGAIPIVEVRHTRINREVVKALALPDIQKSLQYEGGAVSPSTPEEFRAFLRADVERWDKMVKQTGIRVD